MPGTINLLNSVQLVLVSGQKLYPTIMDHWNGLTGNRNCCDYNKTISFP